MYVILVGRRIVMGTRDPYWDDDPCEHDEYEVDIVSGRCECSRCPETWSATGVQIEHEIERQRAYYEYEERENRRQWWRDLVSPIFRPWRALKDRIHIWRLGRNFEQSIGDDEIPF
jgi:hypothetical protein